MSVLPRFLQRFVRRRPHLVLGSSDPFGLFPVSLPLSAFDTHVYVVGKTKKGKSSFLNGLLYQLITQGQGVGLLDPHSDLANDILTYLCSYPRRRPWLSQKESRTAADLSGSQPRGLPDPGQPAHLPFPSLCNGTAYRGGDATDVAGEPAGGAALL